ncbi:MAG: hypothetical protein ACK59X_24910 [Acidovorax sp.]
MIREIATEVYLGSDGSTARRETGSTPNGNPIAQRWVLRDANGVWIDFDQYRHDLFERHGFRAARPS